MLVGFIGSGYTLVKRFSFFKNQLSVLVCMVVVAGFMVNVLAGCQHQQPSSQTQAPTSLEAFEAQQLFETVWQKTKENFWDVTLNGQAPLKQNLLNQVVQTVSGSKLSLAKQTQTDRWQAWLNRYKPLIKTRADAYLAIDTLLASLNDPYSRFLPPTDFDEQRQSIGSHLFGLGLTIGYKKERLQVAGVLEKTPAEQAGLKAGDWITHINLEPTTGMDLHTAAAKIKGPKDTWVQLTVVRNGVSKPLLKRVKRAEITIKSVFSKPLPKHPKVAYIRLSSFLSERIPQEFEAALKQVHSSPALIVDLRGNYGGLLSNAISVSDAFLERLVVVSIEGRNPNERELIWAKPGQLYKGKLVLLVDEASASASEIVAGALQDYHRATLLGTRTYGKGVVQKIIPLGTEMGLNLTVSRYKTPLGRELNHKGLQPDKPVPLSVHQLLQGQEMQLQDVQLEAAIAYLEQQLKSSAPPTAISKGAA